MERSVRSTYRALFFPRIPRLSIAATVDVLTHPPTELAGLIVYAHQKRSVCELFRFGKSAVCSDGWLIGVSETGALYG